MATQSITNKMNYRNARDFVEAVRRTQRTEASKEPFFLYGTPGLGDNLGSVGFAYPLYINMSTALDATDWDEVAAAVARIVAGTETDTPLELLLKSTYVDPDDSNTYQYADVDQSGTIDSSDTTIFETYAAGNSITISQRTIIEDYFLPNLVQTEQFDEYYEQLFYYNRSTATFGGITKPVVSYNYYDGELSNRSYYMFIGRSQPWDELDGLGEEIVPDTDKTLSSEYDVWRSMTALKKIDAQDVQLGIRRIEWNAAGTTVYDQYDDAVDLSTKNFYVMTDEKKVYKCISNNNGALSTEKPTQTTTDITAQTGDGYKWKFMFQITDSLYRKFAVPNYIPVFEDPRTVAQAEIGAIHNVEIARDDSNLLIDGYGYAASTTLPVFIKGDGLATSSCEVSISLGSGSSAGAVTSIVNAGAGYPYAATDVPVMIRQVGTEGIVETAYGVADTDANGGISSVTIIIGGEGYQSDVTANIVVGSAKATATTDATGQVISADIGPGDQGEGYRKAEAIIVALPSGTGAETAQLRPIISPFYGHGADPKKELDARYALVNLRFAYDEGEGDFSVENNFRQFGVIESPRLYGTTTTSFKQTLDAKTTLTLTGINGTFSEDDTIYGVDSGAIGQHVDLVDDKLRFVPEPNTYNRIEFETGEGINSANLASGTISSIQYPEVEPFSGDILYINNSVAIDRSSSQIETITLVLEY